MTSDWPFSWIPFFRKQLQASIGAIPARPMVVQAAPGQRRPILRSKRICALVKQPRCHTAICHWWIFKGWAFDPIIPCFEHDFFFRQTPGMFSHKWCSRFLSSSHKPSCFRLLRLWKTVAAFDPWISMFVQRVCWSFPWRTTCPNSSCLGLKCIQL